MMTTKSYFTKQVALIFLFGLIDKNKIALSFSD